MAAQRRTRRQALRAKLTDREWDFDELCREFQIPVRLLEDDLRHLERSLRGEGRCLRVRPPHCSGCGFEFPGRAGRHLHTPGRCPRCRGERIDPPFFRVGERQAGR